MRFAALEYWSLANLFILSRGAGAEAETARQSQRVGQRGDVGLGRSGPNTRRDTG